MQTLLRASASAARLGTRLRSRVSSYKHLAKLRLKRRASKLRRWEGPYSRPSIPELRGRMRIRFFGWDLLTSKVGFVNSQIFSRRNENRISVCNVPPGAYQTELSCGTDHRFLSRL